MDGPESTGVLAAGLSSFPPPPVPAMIRSEDVRELIQGSLR